MKLPRQVIQKGGPIPYVQSQLGHATIKLTVDTYTHWMPGKNCGAMDRLSNAAMGYAMFGQWIQGK
jgi:integrase